MKISFLGAAKTVTGSKYLVEEAGKKILVDCGLFQGFKELRLKNWEDFPVEPSSLDAVILTHAHLDHSGYIPLLIKKGFTGKVFCTPATKDLSRILLLDSGYLQEEEAKFANRGKYSKHNPAQPLYTRKDAEDSLASFSTVPFLRETVLFEGISFELFPAGHLLGAASVRLKGKYKSILFSGDLGRNEDPLLYPPHNPAGCDVMVVESTYGDRLHTKERPELELQKIITEVIDRGGTVVIPSFAVGRAQLLLYYLRQLSLAGEIPNVPIYLNSPMANSVNGIYRNYLQYHKLDRDEAIRVCQTAEIVSTPEESRALNEMKEPKIILAASGMATGGRVLHHLKAFGPDARNAIVFAGFQAGGTRGDTLVKGASEVKIHGEYWPIRASVHKLDSMSAHADSEEILAWVGKAIPKPSRVYVTHGESGSSEFLAAKIEGRFGIRAYVPELGSEVEI